MAKIVINKQYADYVGAIAIKRNVSLTTALHQVIEDHKNFKTNTCNNKRNTVR